MCQKISDTLIWYFGLKLSEGLTKLVFLKIFEKCDKFLKSLPQNRYFSKLANFLGFNILVRFASFALVGNYGRIENELQVWIEL